MLIMGLKRKIEHFKKPKSSISSLLHAISTEELKVSNYFCDTPLFLKLYSGVLVHTEHAVFTSLVDHGSYRL